MPEPVVVHPDPLGAVRTMLLADAPTAAVVSTRIYAHRLPAGPTWPAIRITPLTASETIRKRQERMLLQIDCFAGENQEPAGAALARRVAAVLSSCANYSATGVVLGGLADLARRYEPDLSFTPPIPRWAITAGLLYRADP